MVQLDPDTEKSLKRKVAILFPWPIVDETFAHLRSEFPSFDILVRPISFGTRTVGESLSDEEWKHVVALLTPSALPTIEQAPELRYVQLTSAGANLVLDNVLFRDTNINFCTSSGVHGPQIAEWVISTYLGFKHHLSHYQDLHKRHIWQKLNEPVYDAVNQTVGILGYGNIGRQVARVCQALGMNVHAYTLRPKQSLESRRSTSMLPAGLGDPDGEIPRKWYSGRSKGELHEFLGSGIDLLLIALPLTTQTTNLLGRDEFRLLAKKRAFVSNIARGPIIVTDDIIEALGKGWISGAALDVQDPEPLPENHPLWNAPNLVLTPHISGNSTVTSERVLRILRHNLQQLSEGKQLINTIDRKENY